MEIDTFITNAFESWLTASLSTGDIRAIEAGNATTFNWDAILESGFADLLLPEEKGGAGATLATAGKLAHFCGRYAVPLPLAFTIFGRAILAQAERDIPDGPITFAKASVTDQGRLVCHDIPFGSVAEHIVIALPDGRAALLNVRESETCEPGEPGSLTADISWAGPAVRDAIFAAGTDVLAAAAAVSAALMAGAIDRVLELSLQHAGARVQFGKPLAAFQAIQQNLSLLAEEAFAVRIVAEQAFAGTAIGILPAAVAKARASKAVPQVNAVGHLVHGAIGITAEFDLQLYTRRLAQWRLSFGGERHWQSEIGKRLLASRQHVLPFLLTITGDGQQIG